jgi:hypothetical protein
MLAPELQIAKFERSIGEQRLSITEERVAALLRKARFAQQETMPARSFSDWVYGLEHSRPAVAISDRVSFLSQARRRISNVLDRIADGVINDWSLESCDDGTKQTPVYDSSVLLRNGHALKLKPDAVFKNNALGIWVIFEYKIPTPGVLTPPAGWPNLAAQLWSYSWAGPWADAKNVLLVGALFDWNGVEATLGSIWPRTTKGDPLLCNSCGKLFRAWGGDIKSSAVNDPALRRILRSQT